MRQFLVRSWIPVRAKGYTGYSSCCCCCVLSLSCVSTTCSDSWSAELSTTPHTLHSCSCKMHSYADLPCSIVFTDFIITSSRRSGKKYLAGCSPARLASASQRPACRCESPARSSFCRHVPASVDASYKARGVLRSGVALARIQEAAKDLGSVWRGPDSTELYVAVFRFPPLSLARSGISLLLPPAHWHP